MKAKKSWDHKWYTDEFLRQLKAAARIEMDGDLPVTVKYAPDAGSELAIDPRLLGGPLGRNAKRMALLPDFLLDRLKMRTDAKSIEAFRENSNKAASAVCVQDGVDLEDRTVPTADGENIPIRIYRSKHCQPDGPCLYFMHGGGFIGGSIGPYDEVWKVFVEKFRMTVISAGYRLMPEHPYPTPHEDCYRGLEWIAGHADILGIDPTRIFVTGDSAGGNLAQYCSTRAKGIGLVRGQILLYPTLNPFCVEDQYYRLDGRNFTYDPRQKRLSQCVVRQVQMMVQNFDAIFGLDEPDPWCNPYTFDAAGNPPTFLSVGALDFLKNDTIAWAHKLRDAGVQVKVVVYNGMGHGYLSAMGVFPQAEDVVDEIGEFILSTL
ncbi:MAG: alpha/beta hydrolase [Oscillospiraceae bacterium]|nr:alpha/beta hydrolase [Oscillospiraceae bacterium]